MSERATPDGDFIKAPFTAEQVDALNRYQRLGYVHEFTCAEAHDGADRALYATREGWRCPHCDYRQDWAHAAMLNPMTLESLYTLPCDVFLPPRTVIRKGCDLATLMTGINARREWRPEDCRFNDPSYQSPIRDLILKLDAVAQPHIAYPQIATAMFHLRDHLSALARCEEINRETIPTMS